LHRSGDLAVVDPAAMRAEAVVAIDGFDLAHGDEHPALCAGLTVCGKRGFAALTANRHLRIIGEKKANIDSVPDRSRAGLSIESLSIYLSAVSDSSIYHLLRLGRYLYRCALPSVICRNKGLI
jgi:hypothetical protein